MSDPAETPPLLGKVSKIVSIVSFILGTLLFGAYFINDSYQIVSFGLIYVVVTAIINFIFFLALVVTAIAKKEHRNYHIRTAGFIMINIPIAFVYFLIVLGSID